MKAHARTLHDEYRSAARISRAMFLDRLNVGEQSAAVRRVNRILELLVELEALRRNVRPSDENLFPERKKVRGKKGALATRADSTADRAIEESIRGKCNQLFGELNNLLSRYRLRYEVQPPFDDGPGLRRAILVEPSHEDHWEPLAVDLLLEELGSSGSGNHLQGLPGGISRYRRCGVCSQWFFAITEHQRFCGDKCRKTNAAKSPAFKEKRRVYMRRLRAQEKNRANAFKELRKKER